MLNSICLIWRQIQIPERSNEIHANLIKNQKFDLEPPHVEKNKIWQISKTKYNTRIAKWRKCPPSSAHQDCDWDTLRQCAFGEPWNNRLGSKSQTSSLKGQRTRPHEPDSGKLLTHHHHIFSKTDTACTQNNLGRIVHQVGVHTVCMCKGKLAHQFIRFYLVITGFLKIS